MLPRLLVGGVLAALLTHPAAAQPPSPPPAWERAAQAAARAPSPPPAWEPVAQPSTAAGWPKIHLELPVLDLPYNTAHGGRWPSMGQSLWLATDAYELMHAAIARIGNPFAPTFRERIGPLLALAAVDLVSTFLPPFLAWQHEEWHRAVLGRRGIDSFNDVYRFRIFAEVIAVSHVRDEDLVRLKREHPAEQVRLSTAGIEGNYALAANLERNAFFEDSRAIHALILPLLLAQNTAYLGTCSSRQGTKTTAEIERMDGADVLRRDFTGLDCAAWTYDLFRPEEPYEARGLHPSGVGIDRYRTEEDLSRGERRYLRRQFWLSWLNFLDPQVWGVRRFRALRHEVTPLEWNAAIRHLPTPFGYALRGELFLRRGERKIAAALQANVNDERAWPELDVALLREPIGRWTLTARGAAWLQPEKQLFGATGAAPGGLASLRLGWRTFGRAEPYLELEAKTAGWVMGHVYLDDNVSVRTGLVLPLF